MPLTQQQRVLAMLREGPKFTSDFAATTLSCEFRKHISLIRKDVRALGGSLTASYVRKGCWRYELKEPLMVEANGQRVSA